MSFIPSDFSRSLASWPVDWSSSDTFNRPLSSINHFCRKIDTTVNRLRVHPSLCAPLFLGNNFIRLVLKQFLFSNFSPTS